MRTGRVVSGVLLAALVLPAVALTVLRLLGPDQGLLVRLTSFAPLAVPLYAGALLVAVPRWLRRRREREGAVLPVLLALAGLALHGWWVAPLWTGQETTAVKPVYRLEVMTTNLLQGRGDPARVMRTAAEHRVDVLVVQEITPPALRGMERLGLGEAYPHRAGRPAETPAGTMVFSTVPLSDARVVPMQFDTLAMTVETAHGPLRLLAVHPRAPVGTAWKWSSGLETLRETVAAEQFDVVVGDFNASADHAPFRRILEDGDLRDATEVANTGWMPTWPADGQVSLGPLPLPPLVAIDHVLIGDRLAAEEVTGVRVAGSDHRALVAHLVPSGDGR